MPGPFVQNEQTICIKAVPKRMVVRVMDAVRMCEPSPKLGMTCVADKDSTSGECLVYANYASARDAVRARDSLETWVADKCDDPRPRVMLKTEMGAVYFAVFVANAPPGTGPAELENLFGGYGRLHSSPRISAIRGSDTTFFVNFATLEGAHAVLEAARRRELRFGGCVLVANAARNTLFINELMDKMRRNRQYSFSHNDARRIGEGMRDSAPLPHSIEALLKAIPNLFVLDRQTNLFHLMDSRAPLSPVSPTKESSRPSSPLVATDEEERAMKRRTDVMNHLLHDNVDLLEELFVTVWFAAFGEVWVDSDGWASSTAATLQQELYLAHLPPVMLGPIADWDLQTLASALTATSLKRKLASMGTRPGAAADLDVTRARCMVLVEERVVLSGEDLHKCLPSFSAAATSPTAAVQTIRFVRNILSHLKVSVKGLPECSFNLLCELASEALSTLAAVLGHSHTERFEMRRAELLSRATEATPPRARSSSPNCAASTRDNDSVSMCSTGFAGSVDHDECGVKEWSVDHDDTISMCSASSAGSVGGQCGVKDWSVDHDDSISMCSTASAGSAGHQHGVKDWSVDQVLVFFESCRFPTAGVSAGQVDGSTLLSLWEDRDAEAIFMAPAPDGLGFNKLMFRGRLKNELANLLAHHTSGPV